MSPDYGRSTDGDSNVSQHRTQSSMFVTRILGLYCVGLVSTIVHLCFVCFVSLFCLCYPQIVYLFKSPLKGRKKDKKPLLANSHFVVLDALYDVCRSLATQMCRHYLSF